MSSLSLPPGYSPPSTVVTDNDHGGWVSITTGVMLCNVLFFLAIRVYIRHSVSPPFRRDDTVLFLATALVVVESVVVFLEISKGFGKSFELIRPEYLVQVQKLSYSTDILYLLDLFLSKCSVCLLFIRLTSNNTHNQLFQVLLGFTTVWMIVSVFIVALRCDLLQPWLVYDGRCSGLSARWTFITTLNVFIEVCLFLGSVLLVFRLQMPAQKKVIVMAVFGSRLPLIAITILRLHYLNHGFASSNPTLIGLPALLLAQIELGWGLISATIPCLNPFMRAVSTNYGAMGTDTIMDGSHLPKTNMGRHGGGSCGIRSVLSNKSHNLLSRHSCKSTILISSATHPEPQTTAIEMRQYRNRADNIIHPPIYRGDHSSTTARVFSEGRADAASIGGDSNDSTRMIIRKEVQWLVQTDKNAVSTSNTPVTPEEPSERAVREYPGR